MNDVYLYPYSSEEARRRAELVVDVQSDIIDDYNESVMGTEREVLCEGFDSQAGCFVGRTYADSVEIDGHVNFTAAGAIRSRNSLGLGGAASAAGFFFCF